MHMYEWFIKRQRVTFPWDLYCENKTYKLKFLTGVLLIISQMHVSLDYFLLIFLYFPLCLLTTVNNDIKKLNLKPQNTPICILVAFLWLKCRFYCISGHKHQIVHWEVKSSELKIIMNTYSYICLPKGRVWARPRHCANPALQFVPFKI